MRITHNRATTFYWAGDIVNHATGVAVSLADYTITSQIRDKDGGLIAHLPVVKDKPVQGYVEIKADSTNWQLGSAVWDIQLKKGDITVSTVTVNVLITEGATHA